MSRSLVVLSVLTFALAGGCKKKEPAPAAPGSTAAPAAAPATNPADIKAQTLTSPELKVGDVTKCPVSGETFRIDAKSPTATHQGKKIYFCCDRCQAPFEKNPTKYLKSS